MGGASRSVFACMSVKSLVPKMLVASTLAWGAAPALGAVTSQLTYGFAKFDGSEYPTKDPVNQEIESDGTTYQLYFSNWLFSDFDSADIALGPDASGPIPTIADSSGDSFKLVEFATEVFCGEPISFDVVGYEDGSQVAGPTPINLSSQGGPTAKSIGFASVDEVQFQSVSVSGGLDGTCVEIDDIIVDQAVSSNTQPAFSGLDATVAYDEASGTPVVIDADAEVSDAELDGANDYAGSTLTVERTSGATTNDDFDFDTSAGTFAVAGSDLTTGGNVFASFTKSGGTLTINFNSSQATATPALADDVLQAITYASAANPDLVEYSLTLTFNDGDAGGALQVADSRPVVVDPDLAPIAGSTTLDFMAQESELAHGDPVDARIIQELLFYGFVFEDETENNLVTSSGLQLEGATSDPATTPNRFESDSIFLLDSIGIENYSTNAQDVTVHGYQSGSLEASETFSFAAEQAPQTFDMDALNPAFLAVDELRFTVSDNGSVAIDNIVVDVGNQSPTLDLNTGTGGNDSSVTFSENTDQGTAAADGAQVTGPVSVGDTDGTPDTITVTLDNAQGDTGEQLYLDGAGLVGAVTGAGSGNTLTLSRNGATEQDLADTLGNVRYQNNSDSPDTTSRTITVEVTDDLGATATATSTVTVEAGNDAPTITAPGGTLQPDEDVAFALSGANEIQIADLDAGSGTVEMSLSANNGTVSLGSTTGLSFDNGANGTGSFTVSGTVTDLNNALATLEYLGDADYFGADTISATVNDRGNTGTDPGATADASSEADTASVSLDVQAVPDAPTITAIANKSTDEDATLSGIAFTIDDAETAAGSLNVSFGVDTPSLVDSHSFAGTGANRTLEIVPAADQSGSAVVTVRVSDGSLTASEDFTLTVNAVNDLPTVTPAISTLDTTVNEDASVSPINLTVDDIESGGAGVTVTASSDNTTLVPNANLSVTDNGGGDRTLNVTLAPDENGTANITVTLYDGTDTVDDSFTLTVNALNDAPAVTLDQSTNTINENNGGSVVVAQITIDDDSEDGSTNNLSLTGADAGDFAINGSDLEFTGTADFETKSTYSVTVEVDDTAVGATPDDTAGFTLSIADVDEAPTFTATGAFSVTEGAANGTAVGDVDATDGDGGATDANITYAILAGNTGGAFAIDNSGAITVADTNAVDFDTSPTFSLDIEADDGANAPTATVTVNLSNAAPSTATDSDGTAASGGEVAENAINGTAVGITADSSDPGGGTVSYALPDDAGGRFQINAGTGVVTVADTSLINFDDANSHSITVQATDDDGLDSGGATFTIAIQDVNLPPAIGNLNGETASVVAGAGASALSSHADATVTNPDSNDYNGGLLYIEQTAGLANGDFGVDGTAVTANGDATISAGETVAVSGVAVATVDAIDDGQGGNYLTLDFNANSTDDRVQAIVRNLTYKIASGLGQRDFSMTLNDGDGTANGGDEDSTAVFAIDVTPSPPVIGGFDGDTVTYTEGDGSAIVDANQDAMVTDADSANFDGGNLTLGFAAGQQAGEDVLSIDTSANVALSGPGDAGDLVTVGGAVIGNLANNIAAGNTLVVNLNADATPARVQEFMRALQYENSAGDDPVAGDRTLRLTVTDAGTSAATSADNDMVVTVEAVNDEPGMTLGASQTVAEDSGAQTVTGFATAFDAIESGQALAEYLVTNDDNALFDVQPSVDNSGVLTYTPAANAAGVATVSVQARDDGGTANGGSDTSAAQTFTIELTNINDAPVLSGTPPASVNEGATYQYQPSVTDPDSGEVLTFSIVGKPSWATFNTGTGALTGTPSDGDVGSYPGIEITVSDDDGASASTGTFSISVSGVNDAPTAQDDSGITVEEDSADNAITVLANDSDQDSVINSSSLTIVTPPANGEVSVESGSVLYTPAADFNGADTFSYTVADSQGAVSNEAIVMLDVSAVNDAPAFVSSPSALAQPDEVYTYEVVVQDVDGDALTLTAEGLPTWLSLNDRGDGTALIEGTPDGEQSGQYSFTLTASDDNDAQAQQTAAVTVVPAENEAPEFVTSPEQKAFSTFSYRYEVRADDASGQEVTLRALNKPSWLSFVDNGEGEGVLMGTPAEADIGRPRIVLEASDEFGAASTQSYDLQVLSGDEATVSADLTVSPATVDVEEGALRYTATVLNDGPIDAGGDVQWDFTGDDLTFATDELPADCLTEPGGEDAVITCPFSALAPGEELTLMVDVSSETPGDVFSRVEVSTDTEDSVPADNTATQAGHFTEVPNNDDSQELGDESVTLAVGDVDGDGLWDVVVATRAGDRIQVWRNAGNGQLEQGQTVDDWDQTRRIVLADMDVDADLDLVLINGTGGRVYHNDGAGQFTLAYTLPEGEYSGASAADLDDDGDPDLVLVRAGESDRVYRNDGAAQFSLAATFEAGDSRAVASADFDLDGYPDLAIARYDGPAVVYRNSTLDDGDASTLSFQQLVQLGSGGFTSVAQGDFSGDGFTDLAFGRDGQGTGDEAQSKPDASGAVAGKSLPRPSEFVPSNPVYANTGTGEFGLMASLGRAPTMALDAADVDGDGDTDLLATNATGAHQVYLAQPDGQFTVDAVTSVATGMSEGRLIQLDDNSELDRVFGGDDSSGAAVFLSGDAEPLRPVDLTMSLTTPESAVLVGDNGTVTGEVANIGDAIARELELVVQIDQALSWDNAQLEFGDCEREDDNRLVCRIDSLGAGATAEFSVDASGAEAGSFEISAELGSVNDERTPEDNSASGTVTVAEPVDDTGGDSGGGGALGWWMLALMGAGLCHRVSGRRRRSMVN